MINNYAKTCKEVLGVLKLVPQKQLKLIPLDVLKQLKKNANNYNESVKIEFDIMGEPKISHDAKVMILSLYRKYFLQENERVMLNKVLTKNDIELERKKSKNYNNINDIFYKPVVQKVNLKEKDDNEETKKIEKSLELPKNKILIIVQRIIAKIKKIFEKK